MARKILFFILLVFLSVNVSFSESVDEIIEKSMKASGADKYKELQTMVIKLKTKAMGMEIPMTIYITHPDKIRQEVSVMGMTMLSIVNGDKGWTSQMGQVTEMTKEQIDKTRSEGVRSSGGNLLKEFQDNGSTITLLGSEKINGVDAYNLKIVSKDGDEMNYYISKVTYLTVKMTVDNPQMGGKMDIVVVENKEINGVTMPWKMDMLSGGSSIGSMEFESVVVNEPIDEKLYDKP